MIKIKNKNKFLIFIIFLVAFILSGFYLFNRIIKLKNTPKKVDDMYAAGIESINEGDFNSATEILSRAVEEDENSVEKLKMLAVSQYNQKNYDEAEENFQKLLEKDVKNSFSYFNSLANIYRDKGEFEKAVEYYEKAIEIDLQYETAYINLAILYKTEMQEAEKAREVIERGLENIPESENLNKM